MNSCCVPGTHYATVSFTLNNLQEVGIIISILQMRKLKFGNSKSFAHDSGRDLGSRDMISWTLQKATLGYGVENGLEGERAKTRGLFRELLKYL